MLNSRNPPLSSQVEPDSQPEEVVAGVFQPAVVVGKNTHTRQVEHQLELDGGRRQPASSSPFRSTIRRPANPQPTRDAGLPGGAGARPVGLPTRTLGKTQRDGATTTEVDGKTKKTERVQTCKHHMSQKCMPAPSEFMQFLLFMSTVATDTTFEICLDAIEKVIMLLDRHCKQRAFDFIASTDVFSKVRNWHQDSFWQRYYPNCILSLCFMCQANVNVLSQRGKLPPHISFCDHNGRKSFPRSIDFDARSTLRYIGTFGTDASTVIMDFHDIFVSDNNIAGSHLFDITRFDDPDYVESIVKIISADPQDIAMAATSIHNSITVSTKRGLKLLEVAQHSPKGSQWRLLCSVLDGLRDQDTDYVPSWFKTWLVATTDVDKRLVYEQNAKDILFFLAINGLDEPPPPLPLDCYSSDTETASESDNESENETAHVMDCERDVSEEITGSDGVNWTV